MSLIGGESRSRSAPTDRPNSPAGRGDRNNEVGNGQQPPGYRPDIDGLRAIAVVLVILFHFGIDGFSGGYIGVDVFFVISGFLITRLIGPDIARGRFSFVRFYERRIRRIIPALFVVIGASFLAGWFVLLPSDFRSLSQSALATVGFVSNIWFWQETENYFARAAEYSPLLHTWSLAVEEQFYIVFPPLLLVVFRFLRLHATVAMLIVICAVSFAYSVFLVAHQPQAAFFLSPGRVWELGTGALLALGAVPPIRARWLREALALAGLAVIVVAAIVFRHATPFPGYAALAPCLGAAALILTGMPHRDQRPTLVARLLSLRPVVGVGLISYSLYLWHWPILVFLRHVYADPSLPMTATLSAIAAASVAAVLSWTFVEQPFRARGRIRRPVVFATWAGASIAVAAVAVLVSAQDRLQTFAMSPVALAADEASRDENPRADACFEIAPEDGLCTFGISGKARSDLLLWGDSHADALMPGMDVAASAIGMSGVFAALGSCPPLLGFMADDRDDAVECRRFNDAVMTELKSRNDIRTVVLQARWATYTDGKGRDRDAADPGAAFERALLRTVDAIRATGREALIVGAVPEIGWDVPRKIIAAERWNLPLPAVPDLAMARALNARADQAFEVAAQRPGVRFIPLIDTLCRPQCLVSYEGRPIFIDTDHVTASAARTLLAPVLRDALSAGTRDSPEP